MIVSLCLFWLGLGLFVLANPERAHRALGRRPSARASRTMRVAGMLSMILAAWAAQHGTGGALTTVAAFLGAMAVASVAVVLLPLRPRLYAATLPLSAMAGAVAWVLQ